MIKPKFLNRAVEAGSSIALAEHRSKSFKKLWHYHPELELMLIREGTGSLFVGDSIGKFEPGLIVLIGKNLPHLWQHDKIYFEKNCALSVYSQAIHFNEDFAGSLMEIPEMADLNRLLQRTKRGMQFTGEANKAIIQKIGALFTLRGYDRIILFLDILRMLSSHPQYKIMSSLGYVDSFKEIRDTKILLAYEYVMNNFKETITLHSVAEIVHMNASAFSRYFASVQKKPFIQFVNEIRIGHACKLLMGGNHNIAGACFEAGFNNLSNFNRQFLSIKKRSPSSFIKQYGAQ
jgi:AraC-like DNA-binding protein